MSFQIISKRIKLLPSQEQVINSQHSIWDHGNKILYDLCKDNFHHIEINKVISKVWLIGRAYSVAIERRKNKNEKNDDFYINKVPQVFIDSEIDFFLNMLRVNDKLTNENLSLVLKSHKVLVDKVYSITEFENRSFCSKYLHFHLPDLFFIYDSRAVNSLSKFISKIPNSMTTEIINHNIVDVEYAKFVCKSLIIKQEIQDRYGVDLTLRQFDNLLLNI